MPNLIKNVGGKPTLKTINLSTNWHGDVVTSAVLPDVKKPIYVALGADSDARNGNPTIYFYLEGSVNGGSTWETITSIALPVTSGNGNSGTSVLEDVSLTTKYNVFRIRVTPLDYLSVYTAYGHAVICYYE